MSEESKSSVPSILKPSLDSDSSYFLEDGKTLNILEPEAKLKRKIPILSDVTTTRIASP